MKTRKARTPPKKVKGNPATGPKQAPLDSIRQGGEPQGTPEEKLFDAFLDTDEITEFLHAQDTVMAAREQGKTEVTLPTVFCEAVVLSMDPEQFPRWQAAWNRVCDELGMTERKKPGRALTAADMTTGKRFKALKTLRYKTRPKEEGLEEGGAF